MYCTLILFGLNNLSALHSTSPFYWNVVSSAHKAPCLKRLHIIFCHYKTILVCDVYLIKLLLNNQKIVVATVPHEILAMPLFRFEYIAITKIMLNRATLVKFDPNYSLSFASKVNLVLSRFTIDILYRISMVLPVQLNAFLSDYFNWKIFL